MKSLGSYVLAATLALLAALVVAQGAPGDAELHLVRAATDASSGLWVEVVDSSAR